MANTNTHILCPKCGDSYLEYWKATKSHKHCWCCYKCHDWFYAKDFTKFIINDFVAIDTKDHTLFIDIVKAIEISKDL
jgi:hypothetical protein